VSEPLTTYEIGPYRPGDEDSLLKTFARVFGHEKPLPVWRWQFLENPAGTHIYVARTSSGEVVSQFAGIPRRVRAGGRVLVFAEIVDSMTDPAHRKGLKHPGLFARTCQAFVDRYGHLDREAVMYGLPNPMAWRIGQALLGYVHLSDVVLLTRGTDPEPPPATGTVRETRELGEEATDLDMRIASQHPMQVIKDALYLDWRYLRSPQTRYRLWEFRDPSGALFGIAATRADWLRPGRLALAELHVDLDHPHARGVPGLLVRMARSAGAREVSALVRPGSPEALGLGEAGFLGEPTHFRFVARTYDTSVIPLDRMREEFALTLGDFDVV
jgi:hypothetical protein